MIPISFANLVLRGSRHHIPHTTENEREGDSQEYERTKKE